MTKTTAKTTTKTTAKSGSQHRLGESEQRVTHQIAPDHALSNEERSWARNGRLDALVGLALSAICLLYSFIILFVHMNWGWWSWMDLGTLLCWAHWVVGAAFYFVRLVRATSAAYGVSYGAGRQQAAQAYADGGDPLDHDATIEALPWKLIYYGGWLGWVFFLVYFGGFCAYCLPGGGASNIVECVFSILIPIAMPPVALCMFSARARRIYQGITRDDHVV